VLFVVWRQAIYGDVTPMQLLVTIGAIFWATTLAAIAAVGIYIIRIYKDVRDRPQFIVASTLGVAMPGEMSHLEKVRT
jgi:hypothetical protein